MEAATGTTTATNYAEDFEECVGILPRDNDKKSPCLHKPGKLTLPTSYVLTKTHCGGYCMDCPPQQFVHTEDSFALACRTVKLQSDGVLQEYTYDASLVERVVHLIRNPFDNLVGRMHLGRKRRQRQGKPVDALEDTPEGMLAWCSELDQHMQERMRKSPLIPNQFLEKYGKVPCHVEWFRLVQWHSLAVAVTEQMDIPIHYLYYENYTTNFNETTAELFHFLHTDAIHPTYPFRPGKSYDHFFSAQHREMAAALVRDMATPPVWNLLKHYFRSMDNHVDRAPRINSPTSTTFPSVALLMSFPNSGTSYTISNTEHVSQRTTASNYGIGLAVHSELPNGPYIHREHMELPSKYLLTKTHCMGYCDDCHPQVFVVNSTEAFLQGCLTGERMVNETRTQFTYDASLVSRAIHLFRDPFDNLVARMHLAVKRRRDKLNWSEEDLARFSHSREGLLSWCAYIDKRHKKIFLKQPFLSDDVKQLMEAVPCSLDWYRWVQWHNRAIEVTQSLQLPVHYLYYEHYSTAYNETLENLLDFLQLPNVQEPMPFHMGKTYRDLYLEHEISISKRLVEALASPDCWLLIQHYFQN